MKKRITLSTILVFILLCFLCLTQALAEAPSEERIWRLLDVNGYLRLLDLQQAIDQKQIPEIAERQARMRIEIYPFLAGEDLWPLVLEETRLSLIKINEIDNEKERTNLYARLLAEKLSAAEVEAIIAFYESEAGKNFVRAKLNSRAPFAEGIIKRYQQQRELYILEFITHIQNTIMLRIKQYQGQGGE